jgi:DNA-binding NarL/FixJ family response regulator
LSAAVYLQAMLAAARGDEAATRTLADQMTQWSAPRGVGAILQLAAQARTLSALTRGDFEAAYQSAVTITKQIGERLYLSPRTIATHLHQVFPKLGVTTRAALRDALAGLPPADA